MRAWSLLVLVACANRPDDLRHPPVPTVVYERVLGRLSREPDHRVHVDNTGALRLGATAIGRANLVRYMASRYPITEDEERGGSGTAMALDLGPCTRTPVGTPLSPELEGRLIAGVRGIQRPGRTARIAGEVMYFDPLSPQRALVYADPTVKASTLVDVITTTRGAIAVAYGDRIGPLRIDFVEQGQPTHPPQTVELRIGAGADVETLLRRFAIKVWCDHEVILPVDVLVTADVDAQQLVDTLVTLDLVGVRMIGLGIAGDV